MARLIGGGVTLFDQLDQGDVLFNGINNNARILSRLVLGETNRANIKININRTQWSNVQLTSTGLYKQIINTPLIDSNDESSRINLNNAVIQFFTSENNPVNLDYKALSETRLELFSNKAEDYKAVFLQ